MLLLWLRIVLSASLLPTADQKVLSDRMASRPLLPTAATRIPRDRRASGPLLPTAAPKTQFCNYSNAEAE